MSALVRRSLPCLVGALCALGASPAGAAQVRGAVDHPANGAIPGGRDIVRAEAAYDDASGALLVVTTFRSPPDEADVLAGAFGTRGADGSCTFPGVVFAGATGAAFDTQWQQFDSAGTSLGRGSGTRQQDGATVIYALAASGFQAQGFTCITSLQVTDASTNARVETVDGFALTPVQDTPTPTNPAPGPAPTTSTTTPAPAPPPIRRAVVKKVARLTTGVVGTATRTVGKGRWTTLRLRVVNGGTAAARTTTVTVSGSRGVTVKVAGAPRSRPGTRALGTLRAGRASTVTVRVRATRAGVVRFRATAVGRLSARGQVAVRLKAVARRRTTARPSPRPALRGPLAGRYFWGTEVDPMYAWDNHALWFVDDRFAYYGFPPAGRPTCSGPTTVTDEKGRPTDEGCRPYTYDPKSGRLTVGALSGSIRGGDIRLGELEFDWELTIPRAGARYEADLEHRGFSGMCGLIMGCTTWHYLFALRADGRFMRSNSTTTTMGDGTSTPFVWGSSMPPDKTGTYEILAGGAIRFRYLDGRVETETIGIERSRGKDDPAGRGIVIGDTNYYPDDDD